MQKQKVGDVKMVTRTVLKIRELNIVKQVFERARALLHAIMQQCSSLKLLWKQKRSKSPVQVLMAILMLVQTFSVGTIFTGRARQATSRTSPAVARKAAPTVRKTSSRVVASAGRGPRVAVRKTPAQKSTDFAQQIQSIIDGSDSDTDKLNVLKTFISAPTAKAGQQAVGQETEEGGVAEQDLEETQGQDVGESKEKVRAPAVPLSPSRSVTGGAIYPADEWPQVLLSVMDGNEMFLAVSDVVLKHFKDNNSNEISYTLTDGGKAQVSTPDQWQKIKDKLNAFKERLLKESKAIPQQVVYHQFAYGQTLSPLMVALSKDIPELTKLIEEMNEKQSKGGITVAKRKKMFQAALSEADQGGDPKQIYYDLRVNELEELKKGEKWREVADLARALIDAEKNEKKAENKIPFLERKAEEYLNEANKVLNTGLLSFLKNKASQWASWVKSFVW